MNLLQSNVEKCNNNFNLKKKNIKNNGTLEILLELKITLKLVP